MANQKRRMDALMVVKYALREDLEAGLFFDKERRRLAY